MRKGPLPHPYHALQLSRRDATCRRAPTHTRKGAVHRLGDVLFDVLLLIRVAARDLSPAAVSLEACAAAACAKLRRRAPYVSGAAVPASPEEAEAWWQRTKEAEKAEAGPAASQKPRRPRRRRRQCRTQRTVPAAARSAAAP